MTTTRFKNKPAGKWRELEAAGFTVYRRWSKIPAHLYTASRAKREKVEIKSEPAAYHIEGSHTWITALFEAIDK